MRIRVCSGFNPAGRLQYGDRFLRTFDSNWHPSVELQVYVEEPTPMPRDAERSLWAIEGALQFNDRHRLNKAVHGREPRPCWKPRELQVGYSFRTDAGKFWKQILIPEAAAADLYDGDILVWLDGDVETIAPVPLGFVPELLASADVAFLGRPPKWSEIGFWAVRINSSTRHFLHDIAEMYRTDAFLAHPQWHSAYIWDVVRNRSQLVERNLCHKGAHGHVWPQTPLAKYTRHDKGPRKPR